METKIVKVKCWKCAETGETEVPAELSLIEQDGYFMAMCHDCLKDANPQEISETLGNATNLREGECLGMAVPFDCSEEFLQMLQNGKDMEEDEYGFGGDWWKGGKRDADEE